MAAAASSPVLPSLFFNNYSRTVRVCLITELNQLRKGVICRSIGLLSRRCDAKLLRIRGRSDLQNPILRTSATARSSEVDGTSQGNQVSSVVLGQQYAERNPMDWLNDFERQLQELFEEVKNMIRMGNKKDARDLLGANYEVVKEQIGAGVRGIEEAAILDVIALGYVAIEDFKMVGFLLDMLNEVVDGLKGDEPLLDSILTHMGSMYSALGKHEKSMNAYKSALENMMRVYGNNSTFLVTPLLGMAKAQGYIGRATKAVELYDRAIAILELSRGANSEDLVIPLSGLGNLLIKEGRAKDAEAPFNRILNIYKNLNGENDSSMGMAMCSLANVKCAQGKAEEAIQLYRDALQIFKDEKSTGVDENLMEKMRIDLAELLHVVGREKEGRELLEECLVITEKCKGKEHPNSVSHLMNLATSYSRSTDFVEAERLLRTSLRIMTKTVGPDDPSISFPMLNLAVTLYNLNQIEEAEELALKVLRIRENAFGRESLPVGEALDCLVSIQTRLGKDDGELLEVLQRVLSIQEKEFGYESEEVMETLKKIVFYMDKLGMKDDKYALQRRLSTLRNKYKQKIQY